MKHNLAIRLTLVKRKSATAPAPPRLITVGYAQLLNAGVEAALRAEPGLTRDELARRAGSSRTTLHRLVKAQPTSIKSAERIRLELQRRLATLKIPPPVVAVEGAAHYQWCAIGKILLDRGETAFFEEALASAAKRADAIASAEEALASLRRLTQPGGSDTDD